MESRCYTRMPSPIGALTLVGTDRALLRIAFETDPWAPRPGDREDPAALARAVAQLEEYFAGARRGFDLPLELEGTDFQKKVWQALAGIPFGPTFAYGELARRIGSASAVRAVGAACGRNPVPIVIPCHRAVGVDGRLTGYRGGLDAKRWLLAHEKGLPTRRRRRGGRPRVNRPSTRTAAAPRARQSECR